MEKVDEIDFNGETVAPEAGQAEKTVIEEVKTEEVEPVKEAEALTEEVEDIDVLPQWAKDRLTKTEEEKENYKKGMLKYKSRTLEPEKVEEKVKEDYPDWDENSKKFQEQTEKKAEAIAERKASQIVEKYNEKAAISKFISQHPELDDDAKWTDVVSNYHPKNGKETQQAIEKDLERAYFVSRYEKGEISKLEAKAFKKGEQKGKTQSQVADLSAVSTTNQKSVKDDGKSVSEGALKLAQAMRVDPTKLAEEDDSLMAEIKF